MEDWLLLNGSQAASKLAPKAGVLFDVVVSPYDIPDAMRGVPTPDGKFRIEFRYIDGKEKSNGKQGLQDHVCIEAGRYSGRILAIEVDVSALGADAVGIKFSEPDKGRQNLRERVNRAWEAAAAMPGTAHEKLALEGARTAFKMRESDLFSRLAGTAD